MPESHHFGHGFFAIFSKPPTDAASPVKLKSVARMIPFCKMLNFKNINRTIQNFMPVLALLPESNLCLGGKEVTIVITLRKGIEQAPKPKRTQITPVLALQK